MKIKCDPKKKGIKTKRLYVKKHNYTYNYNCTFIRQN